MMVRVPSPPLELKISFRSASKTQPSGPGPISRVWTTLPLSASETTSFRLAQVLKSLRCLGVEGQAGRLLAGA